MNLNPRTPCTPRGIVAVIAVLSCLSTMSPGASPPGTVAAAPMRVAVLGSNAAGSDTPAAIAALVNVDRERGITINTSHVEYQTVNRAGRAEFVEEAVGSHFGAAVLVSSGPDPSEVLETARLTRLLGISPVFPLLAAGPYSDDQIAALQKSLLALGYTADNCRIFLASLDGPPSPSDTAVVELRDALELGYTRPDPKGDFLLAVDEFLNTPNGPTSYGRIASGIVQAGDTVEIVGLNPRSFQATVTGVEMFRKILDRGEAGDNVGLLLRGIEKKDIRRGMVIVKPGTTTAHRQAKAEVYVLKKEEGGRHTPFHNKYRPQFYFRTTDVTGEILLEDGRAMLNPGDQTTITVKLINPIAMDKGLRFAIREGGRTVGAGQVTEIVK